MIVNLNGNFLCDTEICEQINEAKETVKDNKKLRSLVIPVWTIAGSLVTKPVHAASFYEQIQPLIHEFQNMALGLGVLGIIAGLGLLAVQKRWGTLTLKTTCFIVGGVFLAPAAVMLFGIIATTLNEALMEAFKSVQSGKEVFSQ